MNQAMPPARRRSSGLLLHPVSLPGPFGIGDFGPAAHDWVTALARARQTWWQVLPLGPTGFGDSPYQSFSSFAGNINLLSPDLLIEDGLLDASDAAVSELPESPIDYAKIIPYKRQIQSKCWRSFSAAKAPVLKQDFEAFCERESEWLDDYALFMALKDVHQGKAWSEWPEEFAQREAAALALAERDLRPQIDEYRFGQFLFFRQWQSLRDHARTSRISIIGDLPIFVAYDSVDVWAQPELFRLDEQRRPMVVAGVPPDYFSATGQLWGNPLYDWEAMRRTGYAWWIHRLRASLRLVDLVRLDHFRGFQAYWEIPAGAATAVGGQWLLGPGADFLSAARTALGGLPLIAEDLGFITPEVDALRRQLSLPGMRILQFAFGGAIEKRFLPHNLERDVVVYTGTHDNDTTLGWYAGLTDRERESFLRYVPGAEADPAGALLRLGWASVADTAIAPLQDLLRLDSQARMNRPGTCAGNWRWRVRAEQLTDPLLHELAALTETYDRVL